MDLPTIAELAVPLADTIGNTVQISIQNFEPPPPEIPRPPSPPGDPMTSDAAYYIVGFALVFVLFAGLIGIPMMVAVMLLLPNQDEERAMSISAGATFVLIVIHFFIWGGSVINGLMDLIGIALLWILNTIFNLIVWVIENPVQIITVVVGLVLLYFVLKLLINALFWILWASQAPIIFVLEVVAIFAGLYVLTDLPLTIQVAISLGGPTVLAVIGRSIPDHWYPHWI